METVLFIKPLQEYSIVIAFMKSDKIYIHDAYVLSDILSCLDEVKRLIDAKDANYPIVRVVFDASIYTQEAFTLRKTIDCDVILHHPQKKFEIRAVNNLNRIKEFVYRKTRTETYKRFMNIFEAYSTNDKYNITIDVLSDVSKYYQINQ